MILLFACYALAAGFLSAVADRFGIWGAPGTEGVAWGSWVNFLKYTALLNPWAPQSWILIIGTAATALEIIFASALILGVCTRFVALGSGLLLLVFALSMTFTFGVKSPLDYSVFSASAAAFLIFMHGRADA